MFAVPGWSVSASALKTQKFQASRPAAKEATSHEVGPVYGAGTIKKRKRRSGQAKALDVNPSNLAQLWETVIEKKGNSGLTKSHFEIRPSEKRQRSAKGTVVEARSGVQATQALLSNEDLSEVKKHQTSELGNLGKRAKTKSRLNDVEETVPGGTGHGKDSEERTNNAQLTPLQVAMRQKLISARFRHLNQTLYTTPSAHSLELFQQNPEMFQEYHAGFRRQVEVWPENPLEGYIQQLKQRGKQRELIKWRKPGNGKSKSTSECAMPLPRTGGICHVADLGCGDAELSRRLEKDKRTLKIQIVSYDLQSPNSLVTKADISNLPLGDNSIDVAILCLALMGTNWIDFIEEAFRILRWKGELWVAEIKSRFGHGGKDKRVEHSIGNRKRPNTMIREREEDDTKEADLLVELDSHRDSKQGTDVSVFVEVLKKRGFALQDDEAVELSNKMFVTMKFVKGLTPIRGQHVPVGVGENAWKRKPKTKFVEDDGALSAETGVLKPCVYKTR